MGGIGYTKVGGAWIHTLACMYPNLSNGHVGLGGRTVAARRKLQDRTISQHTVVDRVVRFGKETREYHLHFNRHSHACVVVPKY